jgi:hypothetical protein
MNEQQSVGQGLARVKSLAQFSVRQAQRCFWIEGVRNFVQACDANYQFESVFYSPIRMGPSIRSDRLTKRRFRCSLRFRRFVLLRGATDRAAT